MRTTAARCCVISIWHLVHYLYSQHLLQHLTPPCWGTEGLLPSASPTSRHTRSSKGWGVGFLTIHRQPSGWSLADFSKTGTYLPLMALKSRIPSAGPQTWTKSSLDIFSRSAPKWRHAPPFTRHTPADPTAGLGHSRASPTLSGH